LGTPLRRALALGLDVLLIAVLSSASLWWLAIGMVVLSAAVRFAMLEEGIERRWAQLMTAALLLIAATMAWQAWRGAHVAPPARVTGPTSPKAEDRARARAELERAKAEVKRALDDSGAMPPAAAASQAERVSRVEQLEAELAALREQLESRPGVRATLAGWLDELGLGLGWSIVYFSLLPPLWNGQTVGKRLFGLQIVELSGAKLTPLRGLKRYGGYVAGMATGGLGFVQILWEPNRQALHDKAAHTVVLDRRAERHTPSNVEDDAACKPPSTNA
jgi:hypothetical protein